MTVEATAARPVPRFARDRRIQAWSGCAAISQAGDAAWLVGLAWTATATATPALAGLILGAGTIPRAVTALYGGALADRFDARRLMVATNAGRMTVLLLAAVVVHTGGVSVPLLLTVTVVFGALDAVYQPANATLPRQMVRAEDLPPAAALFQLAARIARFTGAPLGGVLIAWGGLDAVMLADAASFAAISVFLASGLRPRFPRTPASTGSARRDLAAGFGYLRRTPPARALIVSLSGLNLFVGPALAVGLPLRVHHAHWTSATLGLADALVGAGAAAGALTAIRLRPANPARAGLLILIGQAAAIALIGVATRPLLLLATTTIGVTAGLASAQLSGAFQQAIDPSYVGRMNALTTLGDDAIMPAALAGFGALAATAGAATTCLAAGGAFTALAVWAAARLTTMNPPS